MLTFFQENLATIFVGAAVLSVLILVLWYMYRQRKKARPLGRMRRQLLRLPPFRRLPLQIGGIQAGWSLPSPCICFYISGSATNYVAVGSRQICNAG